MQDWCQFHRPKYKSRKLQEFGTENDNSRNSSPRHCQEPLTLWHPSEFLAKRSVGVTLNNDSASVLTPSRQNVCPTAGLSGRREHVVIPDSVFRPALPYPRSWPTLGSPKPHQDSIHRVQYQEQADLENCPEFQRKAMPRFALTLMMDID